jgi:hypothetical protein
VRRGVVATPALRGTGATTVAAVLLALMCAHRASGATDGGGGQAVGPYVGVAGGAWSIDLIGLSDGGPRPHGHAGGQAELGWLWRAGWVTSASYRWGGSWFDFDAFAGQPLGHLSEETWMVRLILDRRFAGERGRSIWFGAGFFYGEAHIDLNTFRLFTPDPPPNFLSGGLARAGVGFPVGGPLEVYGEIEEAVFRGRGGDPDFQERFRWLGRSLAGHVGLRVAGHRD